MGKKFTKKCAKDSIMLLVFLQIGTWREPKDISKLPVEIR